MIDANGSLWYKNSIAHMRRDKEEKCRLTQAFA